MQPMPTDIRAKALSQCGHLGGSQAGNGGCSSPNHTSRNGTVHSLQGSWVRGTKLALEQCP